MYARLGKAGASMYFDPNNFELVTTARHLSRWSRKCMRAKSVAFDTETTGLDVFSATLVSLQFAVHNSETDEIEACYIPVGHTTSALQGTKQPTVAEVLKAFRPVFDEKPLVLQNAAYDMAIMARYGASLRSVHDTMLMSYALTAGHDTGGHGMDHLAKKYLNGHRCKSFSDVVIPALGHETFADVPLTDAVAYAAEDAAVTLMLAKVLQKYLVARDLWDVYELDRAMLPTIHRMQQRGVEIDTAKLASLGGEWKQALAEAEADVFRHARRKFNIGSAKAIASVLYGPAPEGMGIECWATTKSGAPSTAKAVLEAMEGEHPVVDAILDYRELSKLIGTYTETLPTFVNPATGRVHAQTRIVTTRTGRLSMSDPSLHQIPTRARKGKPLRGRQIREAFVAGREFSLVCADYSQIEVRILAHVTGDPSLIEAFHSGEDIHTAVARKAFNTAHPTEDQRSAAKTITFGILYGMGTGSLARRLGITYTEAEDFTDQYFDAMPTVRDWIESVHDSAVRDECVETIFGRKLRLHNARSKKSSLQARAFRQSVNYIIQGSAADLMRLAITAVGSATDNRELGTTPLLSVHDELVVETPTHLSVWCAKTVKRCMETASGDRVDWRVPIVSEVGAGRTWMQAKLKESRIA